ncbi:25746_t:CDS:2 [Dentiscutata erythropus]|uniref:25746_t:CDS:1 n=1 Tax=Dentiscutata erythropus TaxID=1348616 RepID=A0A9N9G9E9_9GLOM|nr:25746_t:CDS:2 [Dentiscutata erythropus]
MSNIEGDFYFIMSDKEGDFEEDSLLFNSNCETSDNISIGSSNGAISMVQENQSRITKKNWVWKYFEVSKDRIHNVYKVEILNNQNHGIQQTLAKALEQAKIQSNICPDDALNFGNNDSSINLLKLRKAVEWLYAKLSLFDNSDDQADEPFNNTTTYFSGSYYATLSIIYPLIEALKFTFAEFEISSDTPNYEQELSDDSSNNSENNTLDLTNDSSQNTHLIKLMCYIIYNFLFNYWNEPLMVTTLNHKQAISIYTTSSNSNNIHHNRLHYSIFGTFTSTDTASNPLAELECYLDLIRTPIAKDNMNLFK